MGEMVLGVKIERNGGKVGELDIVCWETSKLR
jgi:hypothetical protein